MDIRNIAKEYLLKQGYESDSIDYIFNNENSIVEDSHSKKILLKDRLLVVDRSSDMVIKDVSFKDEMGEFFEIYKHGKDYVMWGEIEIIYLTEELKIKWSFSSRDIFVRRDNKKAIALTEKDIIVTDWLGWCYHIGYDGELISELRVYEDWLA